MTNNPQSLEERLDRIIERLSRKNWLLILLIGFISFMGFNIWLGILFEETGYPVALIQSQLRFNATALKSDFAVLVAEGTLSDYKLIQYLDVGIMVSTAIFFGFLTLFFIKGINQDSIWRKRGYKVALFFPLSGILDAIENVVLLIMLEDPSGFPNVLAYIYSSLALAKLLVFLIGIVLIIVVSIAGRKAQ